MAGDRAHILPLGDKNVRRDLLVVGDHKTEVLVLLVVADHLLVGVLQHPDHGSLGATAGAPVALHHNLHPVAV